MSPLEYLTRLEGQILRYGIKSPDTELYDFGFGNAIDDSGAVVDGCTHYLHVLCRFKVIWNNGEKRTDIYDEDTSSHIFKAEVKHLIGRKVRRIALSDKNDLWLDFGDFHMVFATFENGEESWRFFSRDRTLPHLIASDVWLEFSE